jgi:hypothetical protein
VVLGAHGMHRFTHFYLHFCAPLSLSLSLSMIMHLWESKGLELWWVFLTLDILHTQMLPKNWLSNETLVLRYYFVSCKRP